MSKKRTYLLKSKKNGFYQEFFYSKNLLGKTSLRKGKKFSLKEIEEEFKRFSNKDIFTNTLLKKVFWEKATWELKLAIFLSYFYQQKINVFSIGNVQISSWLKIPFFKKEYDFVKKEAVFGKKLNLKRTILAKVRTKGSDHLLGLRFDNIHLALDWLEGKKVYLLHWDIIAPRLSPISWSKHRLKDR
ncbi:hypothetical protein ISS42_00645 [Candidatus Shapirobacteria bacterium]|nr:hypothetical protein [Candidatus Shapirobacteria bacterium]